MKEIHFIAEADVLHSCESSFCKDREVLEMCWGGAGEVLGRCWGGAGEVLLVAVRLVCKDSGIL